MKHNFLILAFALLSSVQVAFAEVYSGTCGSNLNWSLDTITGAFVITGSGAMDSYTSSSLPWRMYRSYIKTISLPSGLTSICEKAFYNCDSITSVHIPDNVTKMGEAVFMDCDNLKSVNIPIKMDYISKNQFNGCKSLTSIDLHNRIEYIYPGAFKGSGLISIYLPDSVSYIGVLSDKYTPFPLCDSLKEIIVSPANEYFCSVDGVLYNKQKTKLFHYPAAKENATFIVPSSITYIGARVFQNAVNLKSVIIPNSVTSIGYCSFLGCSNLTSINVPNSITSIGTEAFAGCTNLTSFEIPNSVTTIGPGAFRYCTSLTSVVIPNSVTGSIRAWEYCTNLKYAIIGDGVTSVSGFNGCTSLDSVVIGKSVTTIGEQTFYQCSSLKSINIPNNITSLGSSIFRGCTNLANVKLPDHITEIPYSSFQECSSLNAIDIPKSVTSIRSSAFSGCSSLDSVIIPYGVTTIEQSTFNNCKKLTHIEIPNSVTNIQMDAFSQCSGLQFLVLSDSVETIGLRAFSGCNNLTICVPAKAATTSAFFNCKKVIYYTNHIGDYWFNDSTLTGYTGYETELELPYLHNGTTYSIGEHAFAKSNTPITSVIIPSAVTSIGNYALGSVRTLKKVELPVNLTNIATNAFSGCDSIASVSMGLHESTPSIKTLFSSSINKSLKEFIALEGSTLVGTKKGGNNYQMFTNNRIIETIKIPYTVEVIADSTFMNCYNLKSITIGYKTVAEGEPESSPHHIKRHLLSEDNDTLRIYKVRIGECEFQNDTSVTVLVLEDGVEEIGYKAFENCRKLTNITIPNTVKSIGFQAFNKCSKLTDLALYCDFQALLKNGGSYGEQFRDCKSIKNIKLKQRRKIGTGELQPLTRVFAGSLTSIESLEWINSSDTICWTDATSSDKMENIPALRSVKLYEGITGIGNGAFKGSTLLTDIYLPLSLKHIGECAFMNCGIEDMYLFENVETIGKSTLANCANLKKLFIKSGKLEIIPASFCSNNPSLDTIGWPISSKIWAIGESAFANCTSLGVIHIRPSVTTIHSDAFNGCTSVYRLSSHAVTPPIFVDNIYTTTTSSGGLKGVNVENLEKFSVPHKSRNLYANADVWKKYWINGIAATFDENSTTLANNETTTETTPNSVNLSFADDADSYQLNIDGESYTVASYQNGNHQNPSLARRTKMEEGIPGIMFTLTGLKPDTEYSYTITAFDENMDALSVEIGTFRTANSSPTAIDQVILPNDKEVTNDKSSNHKVIINGQIFILRGDNTYTLSGQEVK